MPYYHHEPKQLYGVGLGPALASPKIGRLPKALKELESLIHAGANPRYLTIVPVIRCGHCNGRGFFTNALVESQCDACFGFKFRVVGPSSLGYRKHNFDIRRELL